jgi:hypothetical protein
MAAPVYADLEDILMRWPPTMTFFNKEHILISWRYQLHLCYATTHCPSGITDAHSQSKKKKY